MHHTAAIRLCLLVAILAAYLVALTTPASAQLSALQTIMDFESSGGTNCGKNFQWDATHTASGCWQETNSTWNNAIAPATGLPLVGPGTSYPNGVMDLPFSVQEQGTVALFQAQGFSPWTCNNCNSRLANYVAQQGGPGAFSLQDVASPGTTISGGQTADGGGSTTIPASPPTFAPFSWIWNAYQTTVQHTLTNGMASMQRTAAGQLNLLLVLDLAILGITVAYGMTSPHGFKRKLFTAMAVVALLGADNMYNQYLVAFFQSFPATVNAALGVSGPAAGPAAPFDNALNVFIAKMESSFSGLSIWTGAFWGALLFNGLGAIAMAVALALMFGVWFYAQAGTEILLLLGPLLSLTLLWEYTRRIFDQWVGHLIHLAIVSLVAVVLTNLMLGIITSAYDMIPAATGALAKATCLFGVGLGILIFGFATYLLPRQLETISGAVGAALIFGRAQQAVPGATVLASPIGSAAALGGAVSRITAPVGQSLSRGVRS